MIPEATAPTTLSVSVVVHDSDLEALDATLTKLAESLGEAYAGGVIRAAKVTIRDNASEKSYRKALRERAGAARARAPAWLEWVLELDDANPGFGAAHNAVQRGAGQDFLLILNPDVELQRDSVTAALAFMRDNADVAALNPHCRRSDGRREYLCKRYPTMLDLLLRGFAPDRLRTRFRERLARYEYHDLEAAHAQEVELLSGACLFCRRDAFERVGGFDESFFLYFEDFDLSLRLARCGRLLYQPRTRALHHGGFAARKGLRHQLWFARSAARFFRKHGWRFA